MFIMKDDTTKQKKPFDFQSLDDCENGSICHEEVYTVIKNLSLVES